MKYTIKTFMKSNNRCVDSSIMNFFDDECPVMVMKILQREAEADIESASERFQKEKSEFYATVRMNDAYLCEFTFT